ncbi:MAG: hypothetical protein RLO06_06150 [Parvibaculum sp.]
MNASIKQAPGGLWRDVVNELGEVTISPDMYLPVLESIASRWNSATSHFKFVERKLRESRRREDVLEPLERARLGYGVWKTRRSELRTWVNARRSDAGLTEAELESWWFGEANVVWLSGDHGREFLDAVVGPTIPHREVLVHDLEEYGDVPLDWFRINLRYCKDLERLREMARKTWPADVAERRRWSWADFDWINRWLDLMAPALREPESHVDFVDPSLLEVALVGGQLPLGSDDLSYCLQVLIRDSLADFITELTWANAYPRHKGALRCAECARFVGRNALGYGQRYCSSTCKKRASKRRQRLKKQTPRSLKS